VRSKSRATALALASMAEPLTDEQVASLARFAAKYGDTWKAVLATQWMRCAAPPELHRLRNSHGTAWLRDYACPFVCFYARCWGTGASIEEAKANARKRGGRGSYRVVRLPAFATDVHVDAMGRLSWNGAPGEPELVVERIVAPKAVRR
jgi:hypothetical protein